ncbi:glucans biosynthesis glucosyltransferase MdoH [Modicisalibacter tunisiensis]|uniref:glucans biosynthesis glucosyltransferase MdoH n=1 Tax=Modicisalibacter tunisiensis TaxID=390637 RepID=UPI001CC90CBC|nr:glucans biosynthesis glucosyltransferase MdoH [Modicisalibacter tunisiensis]MBZ9540341.1 glucans biosynthesis glucosyltransferase MdoH [Modicisalibacter tunisiensis]
MSYETDPRAPGVSQGAGTSPDVALQERPESTSSSTAAPAEASTAGRSTPPAQRMPMLGLRRLVFFTLAIVTSLQGAYMMFDILRANGLTVLEGAILGLFVCMFAWLTMSFWSAIAGFLVVITRRDPLTLKRAAPLSETLDPNRRIALVMPVYNEDTARVIAGLEATCHSLAATGKADAFDVFLLSDTTDSEIADAERRAAAALSERMPGGLTLYYRRRERNIGRKVGNLAEFCCRWGDAYESMIVLDADSVMGGETLVRLAATMQANPRLGLLQTVPLPARSNTLFGRFLQFAATLYSPMLAAGQSVWQGDTANYWGHNAIIRITAFVEHCGLPPLPGKAPMGGEILSHDFVEAALLRRAGWEVRLHAGLEDSYEELPGNMVDYAKRDRRWCQGNMQHLRLLLARGLHPINRLHFLLGALAYMASLLWLIMLGLSTVDAVVRAVAKVRFFNEGYQLFPEWPESKVAMIASLLVITVLMLLLPKLLGVIVGLLQRRRDFGGGVRLAFSALVEVLFSILIAPLMMAFHAWFVVSVLAGRTVSWSSQVRGGRLIPWSVAWRRTGAMTLLGLLWGGVSYYFAPLFFWWLSPVLLGMVASAPLLRYTSSIRAGEWMQRHGLVCIPAEVNPPWVLTRLEQLEANPPNDETADVDAESLLPETERRQTMPTQSLRAWWGLGGAKPPSTESA